MIDYENEVHRFCDSRVIACPRPRRKRSNSGPGDTSPSRRESQILRPGSKKAAPVRCNWRTGRWS